MFSSGRNPVIAKKRDRDRNRDRDRDRDRDRRDRDRDRDGRGRDRDDWSRNRDREREDRDRGRGRDYGDKRRRRDSDIKKDVQEIQLKNIVEDTKQYLERVKEEEQVAEQQAKVENVPISLEDLMKKRAEEEKKAQKPVFLTKEQRQKAALEERRKQAEAMRQQMAAQRSAALPTEPSEREQQRERERNERAAHAWDMELERIRERELEQIKQQYIGTKKEKRKILKPSEKFKLMFEWDADDDTQKEGVAIADIEGVTEFRPQFGRGFIGGMDRGEQIVKFKHTDVDAKKAAVKAKEDEEKLEQIKGLEKGGTHWSEKPLEKMTARDWRIFKEDHSISCKGGNIPNPLRSWAESTLPDELKKALEEAGYKEPTPIQRQAIPIALAGRDIVGIAETGSGKTAAFVLPMLVYISHQPKMTQLNQEDGPYAIILAPVRELAQQIEKEAEKFAKFLGYRCISLVGGVPLEQQGYQLRNPFEIVVATPGRLNDCLRRRFLVLNQCNYVVMDEADRMIAMGFEEQVSSILEAMPNTNLKSENESIAAMQEGKGFLYRTTIMYSATMPPPVERIARKYLRRAVYVQIGDTGQAGENIQQNVIFTSEGKKPNLLLETLRTGPPPPTIVFVNIKRNCDMVARALTSAGYNVCVLHSGKTQEQREYAMEGFREGMYDILVATDVAGRGIDIPGVGHVINYDLPKGIEPYTHRIGRTGRAGMTGVATSFITNDDTDIMYDLKQMLQDTKNTVPSELAQHAAASQKPGAGHVQKKRRDTIIYAN